MEALKPQAKKCPKCGLLLSSVNKENELVGTYLNDRYFIGSLFKKESATNVYLGYDEQREQTVLIRVFTAEMFCGKEDSDARQRLIERFVSYGKSMAAFSLCNLLPRTIDVFSLNSVGFMVQEWFDGQSLKELLAAGVKISEGNALRITEQLCSGLKILHNSHMIYGNLSPDTLYILKDGSLRLFGLGSPFFDFVLDLDKRTEFLNPSYAAPELFAEAPRGAYTDVYSVAAILNRIVTDVIPPISFLRHEGDELRSPKKYNPALERSVGTALLNAMNWETSCRTKTLDRFLKELPNKNVRRRYSFWSIWALILGKCSWLKDWLIKFLENFLPKCKAAFKTALAWVVAHKKLWLWIGLGLVSAFAILLLVWWLGFGADTALLPGGNRVTSSDGWYYGTGKNQNDDTSKQSFLEQFGVESENDNSKTSQTKPDSSSEPNDGKISCPDLIGYYKNYALSLIKDLGLEVGKITEEYSSEYSRGYIMGQGVKPDTRLEPGSPVSIVISKGTEPPDESDLTAPIPDVTQTELLQAVKLLQEAGFTNITFEFEQGTATAGTVVAQSISPQTEIATNTEIVLTVCGRSVTVPDYLGLTLAEAKNKTSDIVLAAEDAHGIPLDISSIDATKYRVIKQSVAGGTEGYAELKITLTVQPLDSNP